MDGADQRAAALLPGGREDNGEDHPAVTRDPATTRDTCVEGSTAHLSDVAPEQDTATMETTCVRRSSQFSGCRAFSCAVPVSWSTMNTWRNDFIFHYAVEVLLIVYAKIFLKILKVFLNLLKDLLLL